MWKDPIVDEVRAVREAYAKRFDYDIRRIGKDLQKQESARSKTSNAASANSKPQAVKRAKRPET